MCMCDGKQQMTSTSINSIDLIRLIARSHTPHSKISTLSESILLEPKPHYSNLSTLLATEYTRSLHTYIRDMEDETVPSLDVLPPAELSECRAPQTAIRSAGDLARFTKHSTYKLFLAFLMNLNHAIKGCGNSSDCHVSQVRPQRASAACTSTNTLDLRDGAH